MSFLYTLCRYFVQLCMYDMYQFDSVVHFGVFLGTELDRLPEGGCRAARTLDTFRQDSCRELIDSGLLNGEV
jgi:hypothetical protein